MNHRITPHPLSGAYRAMPSKSHAHRLFICAALADRPTHIILPQRSQDMDATLTALQALGADVQMDNDLLTITPIANGLSKSILPCKESGSTLRFMLPVVAALGLEVTFTGEGRLPERPLDDLLSLLTANGVSVQGTQLPLTLSGKLSANHFTIRGDVSSQYITGLLLAAPLLGKDVHIHLSTPLESAAYVSITCATMAQFGVRVETLPDGFLIAAGQRYTAPDASLQVDGDWSNAAFFLAAGALGEQPVSATGLDQESCQGDRAICDCLSAFGAKLHWDAHTLTVHPAPLKGTDIDVSGIPDLLPILSVVASQAQGHTHFYNAARLRLKESDRLETTTALLRACGGTVHLNEDSMTVEGGHPLKGATLDAAGDHRIAMCAAILGACCCNSPAIITGSEAVNKSYPHFFNDFILLGGQASEFSTRTSS